jgi:hypothetical protein
VHAALSRSNDLPLERIRAAQGVLAPLALPSEFRPRWDSHGYYWADVAFPAPDMLLVVKVASMAGDVLA